MTAVVSENRARATWLTGVSGLLILVVAAVMVVAAPASAAHPGAPATFAVHAAPGPNGARP
jgi:uncharacterized integral membrane protein